MEYSYHSDRIHGELPPPVISSRDTGSLGLHTENLFDQDETPSGEKVNHATGEPIDNSTATDFMHFNDIGRIVVPGGPSRESTDVLGPILEQHDAASEWLLEQGYKL